MNKFVGVAYWRIDTENDEWIKQSVEVLRPLETAGLGTVQYDSSLSGETLILCLGEEKEEHKLFFSMHKGRGVVRHCITAAAFIVCLVALRKALGDMSITTDSHEEVPRAMRQDHPLYAGDWHRVREVAGVLGLVMDERFRVRHQAILGNIF